MTKNPRMAAFVHYRGRGVLQTRCNVGEPPLPVGATDWQGGRTSRTAAFGGSGACSPFFSPVRLTAGGPILIIPYAVVHATANARTRAGLARDSCEPFARMRSLTSGW